MKKLIPINLVVASMFCLFYFAGMVQTSAQTFKQSCLIDFGPNEGTNGAITDSPDANGLYWNNLMSGTAATTLSLVDTLGVESGISVEVTDAFVVNTSTNYGPTTCSADDLGNLAIATATQDYFYLESSNATGQLTFRNLNSDYGYKFSIFASRPTSSTRETSVEISGLTSYSETLQTSDGSDGNLDYVLSSKLIFPDAEGQITIDLGIVSGGYGYINLLKLSEFSDIPLVEVTSIDVSGDDITLNGESSLMSAEVLPADATNTGVNWRVSDTTIAMIDEDGILYPRANGTLTVTATSIQNPEISGSTEVNISNQITALYLSGAATEIGDQPASALAMHMVTGADQVVRSQFEIYTSLTSGETFTFYLAQASDAGTYGMGSEAGVLVADGTAITAETSGPVLIEVDLEAGTYSLTSMSWSVVGSTITDGWSGDAPLTYVGGGIWRDTLDMDVVTSDTDPRFIFRANQNWSYSIKERDDVDYGVLLESTASTLGLGVHDIDLTYGVFVITLNLSDYTYSFECKEKDAYKITFLGSSVCNGQGATDMEGYAYLYDSLLQARADAGSLPFYRSNQAVNGNNTLNVLDRFNSDLLGDCSQYVVFGLSLGNEGITADGQAAFDQFEENMLLLIDMAEENNITPVVMSNYTRADFDATDYAFIKAMNLKIAQWDVPSFNALGTVDNGSGNWLEAYQDDMYHPNDAGHAEMFYAMVPSLFDALEAGKTAPAYTNATSIALSTSADTVSLAFTPEEKVHPFTVAVDIKTLGTGTLMKVATTADTASIALTEEGYLCYTTASGEQLIGASSLNDGEWHTLVLSHYYARGYTFLYQDGVVVDSVAEQVETQLFTLEGSATNEEFSYRNWFFYRSAMNALEVEALSEGKMLKSSLELYAPLDAAHVLGEDALMNYAQSTNEIIARQGQSGYNTSSVETLMPQITLAPNPVKDCLQISHAANYLKAEVYGMQGQLLLVDTNTTISLSGLLTGMYLVQVYTAEGQASFKVQKID